MKTVGFFNNKGGVGKTSLVYHLSWMLSRLGIRVIAVDLDPQANLSSIFLDDDRLEQIWESHPLPTMYGAVSPQFRGTGDIQHPNIEHIEDGLGLLVGDLELSRIEDALSDAWPKCHNGDELSFRKMSAFGRAIAVAGAEFNAQVGLVDVGPNLGALNRAALLACDFVVVPVGADLFSLQGLRNMGPTLREWRRVWSELRNKNPDPSIRLPEGTMKPIGYIVMRHAVLAGRPARAYSRWIQRMPDQYRRHILDMPGDGPTSVAEDPNCLSQLKDYRSLMPMAQEARKPMFMLRPADGAFGGHQQAVLGCWTDFKALATTIMERCGVPLRADASA